MRALVARSAVVLTLLLITGCNDDDTSAVATSAPSSVGSATTVISTPTPTPTPSPSRASSALLAPNRAALAACVAGVGPAAVAVPTARQRIEQALTGLSQQPVWGKAGLAVVPRVVDIGCPSEPYLLQPGVTWEDGVPITGAGPRVETASSYRLFVFVLPPDELSHVIRGRHDIRTAAQELLCRGHQCAEVSTGLYLTPDEVSNNAFLQEWLAKGLGLEPPVALPPNAPVPVQR